MIGIGPPFPDLLEYHTPSLGEHGGYYPFIFTRRGYCALIRTPTMTAG
jgi:hypothetical protein